MITENMKVCKSNYLAWNLRIYFWLVTQNCHVIIKVFSWKATLHYYFNDKPWLLLLYGFSCQPFTGFDLSIVSTCCLWKIISEIFCHFWVLYIEKKLRWWYFNIWRFYKCKIDKKKVWPHQEIFFSWHSIW